MCRLSGSRPRGSQPHSSIVLIVDSHIGSSGLMNLIMGISSVEASASSVPFDCQVNGIHHLAVNVELQLLIGGISDAYRPRILVSRKMVQTILVELLSSINPIYDLQWPSLRVADKNVRGSRSNATVSTGQRKVFPIGHFCALRCTPSLSLNHASRRHVAKVCTAQLWNCSC